MAKWGDAVMALGGVLVSLAGFLWATDYPQEVAQWVAAAGVVAFVLGLILRLLARNGHKVEIRDSPIQSRRDGDGDQTRVRAEQGTAGRDQYQALQGSINVGDRIIRNQHREQPVIRIKEDGVMLPQRDELFAVFPRVKVANPDAFHRAAVRIRLFQQDGFGSDTVSSVHSPTADALAVLRRAYKNAELLPEVVEIEREDYREGAAVFLLPWDFAAEAEKWFLFRLIDDLTDREIRAEGSADGGIARLRAAQVEDEI